eukprot:4387771-Pyramimonas_sp.AAC.1
MNAATRSLLGASEAILEASCATCFCLFASSAPTIHTRQCYSSQSRNGSHFKSTRACHTGEATRQRVSLRDICNTTY